MLRCKTILADACVILPGRLLRTNYSIGAAMYVALFHIYQSVRNETDWSEVSATRSESAGYFIVWQDDRQSEH